MSNNLTDLEGMAVTVKEFRKISKANRLILLGILTKEHEILGDKLEEPFWDLKDRWIKQGRQRDQIIPYIKEVRQRAAETPGLMNFGLKEAKDLVESW